MTNTMTYKGYSARIGYDDEDGMLEMDPENWTVW